MTLRDYAQVVWRRKWLVLIPTILTALVALTLSLLQTPQYKAQAQVVVTVPVTAGSVSTSGSLMTPRMVENELSIAAGSELRNSVLEMVGSDVGLSVASNEDSDVFTFSATSTNADRAADAANTYAGAYIERQRSVLVAEYEARRAVIQEELAAIADGRGEPERLLDYQQQFADLGVSIELAKTSGSTLIDRATPPSAPFEPQTLRTVVLALVVGLLIGLGAAFLVDYLDTSIRDEDDIVRASGLPNLAVVPRLAGWSPGDAPHLATKEDPHSTSAEAYRGLRAAVTFLGVERTLKTVLVTSPRPGEGKTTTATNLALAASRAGQKVMLIDCDLRKPQVHLFFHLPNELGFTTVIMGDATMQEAAQVVADEAALAVVTSGTLPPNPSELLAGERTRKALEKVAESVDLVVIDSPPVLPVADPLVLCSMVDGVILVASAEVTDRRQLQRAVERLAQIDAPLLGTVLNRYEAPDDAYYGYTYGYATASRTAPVTPAPTNTNGHHAPAVEATPATTEAAATVADTPPGAAGPEVETSPDEGADEPEALVWAQPGGDAPVEPPTGDDEA